MTESQQAEAVEHCLGDDVWCLTGEHWIARELAAGNFQVTNSQIGICYQCWIKMSEHEVFRD